MPHPHDVRTARALLQQHAPETIARRLESGNRPSYLGDAVLGSIDGAVTTFAVVAGAAGAGLSPAVALVIGLSNVVADGFSMAAGNALRAKADHEILTEARAMEERHVDEIPDGEREEVRQIFASKGFEGRTLEDAVAIVTSDRRRWVDTMLTEELGLSLVQPSPPVTGTITFFAFVAAGLVPLAPLLFVRGLEPQGPVFLASLAATALTFFAIGWAKGRVLGRPPLRAGLETLVIGGLAAALAFVVGRLVGRLGFQV
jgi:VIT1/CCC1 family predicted Fe2+/Mn2+ transporter